MELREKGGDEEDGPIRETPEPPEISTNQLVEVLTDLQEKSPEGDHSQLEVPQRVGETWSPWELDSEGGLRSGTIQMVDLGEDTMVEIDLGTQRSNTVQMLDLGDEEEVTWSRGLRVRRALASSMR